MLAYGVHLGLCCPAPGGGHAVSLYMSLLHGAQRALQDLT